VAPKAPAPHAGLAALRVNPTMNGSTFLAAPWTNLADLPLGAAAGLALNRRPGGTWRGAGVYFGARVATMRSSSRC